MIELGDRKNRGFIDIEDFMVLMRKMGLINKEVTELSDLEKEFQRELEKRLAEEAR